MKLKIYQVDAFANAIFEGNPAAVCVLDSWLPDIVMQAIAAEMNLSETAFLVAKGEDYKIRWFTPSVEVKLCGHATLASAHVLFNHLEHSNGLVRFHSKSGTLVAQKTPDQRITLDFPCNPPTSIDLTVGMAEAVGGNPLSALAHDDLILVYADATEIEILTPDFAQIAALPYRGIIATAPGNGNGYDFVCRFFAPAVGVNEDPVTGSAFTELAPYYQRRFGKSEFMARQVSKRGGDIQIKVQGERVHLSGYATTVMEGTLNLQSSS